MDQRNNRFQFINLLYLLTKTFTMSIMVKIPTLNLIEKPYYKLKTIETARKQKNLHTSLFLPQKN